MINIPICSSQLELRARIAALGIRDFRKALTLMTVSEPLLPAELATIPPEVWFNTPGIPETLLLAEGLERIPCWKRFLELKPPIRAQGIPVVDHPRLTEMRQVYQTFPSCGVATEKWFLDRLWEQVEIGCSRPNHHLMALSALALSPESEVSMIIDRMLLSPWPELFFSEDLERLLARKPMARASQIIADLKTKEVTEDTVCIETGWLGALPAGHGLVSQLHRILKGQRVKSLLNVPVHFWTSKLGKAMATQAKLLKPATALHWFGPAAVNDLSALPFAEVEAFCRRAPLSLCLQLLANPKILNSYAQQTRLSVSSPVLHQQLVVKALLTDLEVEMRRPTNQVLRFLVHKLQISETLRLSSLLREANYGSLHLFTQFLQRTRDMEHPQRSELLRQLGNNLE